MVQITATGWSIIPAALAPVRFRRPKGLLPLPEPTPGGRIDDLRAFINVKHDDAYRLIVAWLLGALRPTGPYAMLSLFGELGCCAR